MQKTSMMRRISDHGPAEIPAASEMSGTGATLSSLRAAICAGFVVMGSLGAEAATLVYDLNGSLAPNGGGQSLVANGGSLGATGYTFGRNQGLSLSNVLPGSGSYSIDITFRFDSLNGYQKIIDFKNLTSDTGVYTLGSAANFFPVATSPGVFAVGQLATLSLVRDAASNVFVSVNGTQYITFFDTPATNFATFSGPGNIANFFIDDFATGQREAASGFVDRIVVTTGIAAGVPEPGTWAMMILGFLGLGWVAARGRGAKAVSA